ncbi:MAG: ABC transporter permease [Nannocystaceae bacterium]|nr:ABC transporter permease [Myxococcales bacterium]
MAGASSVKDPAALHGRLLLLWVLSWISLALSFLPPEVLGGVHSPRLAGAFFLARQFGGFGVLIGLGILLVLWFGSGFLTGYERVVGLRIIRRERVHRGTRVALYVCVAVVIVALALLLAGLQNLALVLLAAIGTFVGLLLLLMQFSSIFGTTSIIGVVLGVAALIVVQSVATGFQHEFERRVLGVYAHINVTRTMGIAEYRRFEQYLRTVPGVIGASPFAYYTMLLAPYKPEGGSTDELRLKSVLVKGIDPATADEVIDLRDHLLTGSGRPIELDALTSDYELMPVPDREPDKLPAVINATPDPRGENAYDEAMKRFKALPEHKRRAERLSDYYIGDDDDDWPVVPEPGEEPGFDASSLPTIFIGATLARELKLGEGSLVMVVDPGSSWDTTEEPQFQYYRIAGIFQAGFQEYDSRLIYTHIKELQRFKYRGKDIVSGVDLRLRDPNLASEVGAAIREALEGREYQVLEWQKLNQNLFESIRFQKNLITIILSLVITVATFNVLSALWTMVVRRNAEIAILMSMGATGPQVARVFQITGMAIGLAGSLAGVGFGLMLCWLVELFGYTLDPEVYFIEELPVEISMTQIGWILGMTLAICFVATIPPSLRAAKLRPVDGLRYE